MPAWISSPADQYLSSPRPFLGLSGHPRGTAWRSAGTGLGDSETPGLGKSTARLWGMLRASLQLWGAGGTPTTLCPCVTSLSSVLVVPSKAKRRFVSKAASAAGRDVARAEQDQTSSFLEVSLQEQRAALPISFPRGDVGGWFIYCFSSEFG